MRLSQICDSAKGNKIKMCLQVFYSALKPEYFIKISIMFQGLKDC